MAVSVLWTKHLKGDAKDGFIQLLQNNRTLFTELERILYDDLEALDAQESKLDDFETPAWSEKQAYRNGVRSYIRKMIDLIPFKQGS